MQTAGFFASPAAIDPDLASLFASSSGPVKAPERISRTSESNALRPQKATSNRKNLTENEGSASLVEEGVESEDLIEEKNNPPRKRRKIRQVDDIESTYLRKLAHEDVKDETRRRNLEQKQDRSTTYPNQKVLTKPDDESNTFGKNADEASIGSNSEDDLPQHESLRRTPQVSESDKSKRTVFLGNVSTSAIKSKSAKNALMEHLRNAVKEHKPVHKVESLRFRSTAFVGGAGPKKAAFAKGELMDQTTQSTNAYVVYTTEMAAQGAAAKLNGTIVLDRHLRADSLAAPTPIEHRRCIFVGNLSFVDEETQEQTNEDGTPRRPKAKVPADAEEGLWRTFSKIGKVESVRVVRDKETRIGKGFAYVQFFDENAVEAALLMNDKKFPPLLPRKLRVMRAKRTKQKSVGRTVANASSSRKSTDKRFGAQNTRFGNGSKPGAQSIAKPRSKEGTIFEGHRASKSSRESNIVSKHRKRHAVKPSTRSSKRGAAFKAAGGKQGPVSS